MMPTENHLTVSKTARYFTLGKLNEHTKTVWIVIHGFAQRAEDFIKEFSFLDTKENFVIAPEALNRFYKKGSGGDTAATWMTKDDRANEISDYVSYLNGIYDHLLKNIGSDVTIHVLGFSQGAATLSRWMVGNERKVDNLVFYAGEIGREIIEEGRLGDYAAKNKYYLYSKQDPIIPVAMVKEFEKMAEPFDIVFIEYIGGHEITEDALSFLVK